MSSIEKQIRDSVVELIDWEIVGQRDNLQLLRIECVVENIFEARGLVERCVVNDYELVSLIDPRIRTMTHNGGFNKLSKEIKEYFPNFNIYECVNMQHMPFDNLQNPSLKKFAERFDGKSEAIIVTYITADCYGENQEITFTTTGMFNPTFIKAGTTKGLRYIL